MKKKLLSILSILMCVCLLAPTAAAAAPAQSSVAAQSVWDSRAERMRLGAKLINAASNVLITALGKTIGLLIPNTKAIADYRSFNLDEHGAFLSGNDTFLDEPAENAQWQLGYAKESIMPADFSEKGYTMGGYKPLARTTEKFDDLCVRTIVLDDGSGRGKTVFAVLDAIGIANDDVRLIRRALGSLIKSEHIVSLNVSVTHTHSGIDLQGVWDNTVSNVWNNLTRGMQCYCNIKSGVDRTFLETVISQTKKSVEEAVANMQPGTLTLAKKDISDYMRDRTAPYCFDGNLYRLLFVPQDAGAKPTVIATYSTHPENSGYGHVVISSDFIAYTDELMAKAGYNFIYIQGCIGTVTYARGNSNDGLDLTRHEEAVRYGYEMGYILLSLTKTEQECATLNEELGDFLGVKQYAGQEGYSVWYAGWKPVEEETIDPILNIKLKQYVIPVTNVLMTIIGKVGITDYLFLYDKKTGKYYGVTECGYMELGHSLKVELCPGETYGELLLGGEGLEGFAYPSLRSIYGEDLIVFDLMNDAIGYIEPDNEFVMAGVSYSEKNDEYDTDTWCLISFGKNTASIVIGEFIELVKSVRG